jgi:hypothetical protein
MYTHLSRRRRLMFNEEPPAGDPQVSDQGGGTPPADPAPAAADGFPADTPVVEMTVDQQLAYWKHQSRKHEGRVKALGDVDALRDKAAKWDAAEAEKLTPSEKAIEEARAAERAKVLAEQTKTVADRLVAAEFKVALAGRKKPEEVAALLEPLDLTKFLTSDGEVDADKVKTYADGIAPSGTSRWPDTGQGNRGTSTKPTGLAAGRALYEDRKKK